MVTNGAINCSMGISMVMGILSMGILKVKSTIYWDINGKSMVIGNLIV